MTLAPDYKGVDVEAICNAIRDSEALKPKSEFESSAAYSARLSGFTSTKLVTGLSPIDKIAIVFGDDSGTAFESTYDADAQAFAVKLKVDIKRMYLLPGSPMMAQIKVKTKILNSSDYEAGNAMGAKVQVHEVNSETYGIALDPTEWPASLRENSSYSEVVRMTIPMPSEVAIKAKANLRVAMVGSLHTPWIGDDVFSKDPTISDPYKMLDGQKYLLLTPMELIIFRADTGEILYRNAAGHKF
jgi:hypothetical protein